MESVIRNGEYIFTETVLLNDIIVPVRPHENAIYTNGEWVLNIDELLEKANSADGLELLKSTDWKVLRHQDQLVLNVETTLTQEEYLELLQQRENARNEVKDYATN